jgi:superfamily I DNA/RNA helicase
VAVAAVAAMGLALLPVPSGSSLLYGASAVLLLEDASDGYLIVDGGLAEEDRAFAIGHELGHLHLHADSGSQCVLSRLGGAAEPAAGVEIYNPLQRREAEANLFAAELLAPGPLLREHVRQGARLSALRSLLGVSEAVLLDQMDSSLLLPNARKIGSARADLALDPMQQFAVQLGQGPVLVQGGPGTGKTHVLMERVRYLLTSAKVDPHSILVLTFTERAAAEIRERLDAVGAPGASLTYVGTLDAFCLDLLRRYADRAGIPPSVSVMDPTDILRLLEPYLLMPDAAQVPSEDRSPKQLARVLGEIAGLKRRLLTADCYSRIVARFASDDDAASRRARQRARIYEANERLLVAYGMVDFADLRSRAVSLLRDHRAVRCHVQATYRHVLVDECQDLNRADVSLLRLLAGTGAGLCLVGDHQQAIYSFRGAGTGSARIRQAFPTAQMVTLAQPHRADPRLAAVLHAIASAMDSAPPDVHAAPGLHFGSPNVRRFVAADADREMDALAALICNQRQAGFPYHSQAVLLRSGVAAETVAKALIARDIPVTAPGNLLARREIAELLDALIVMHDNVAPPAALAPAGAWEILARALFEEPEPLGRLLAGTSIENGYTLLAYHQLLLLARTFEARQSAIGDEGGLAAFLRYVRRLRAGGHDRLGRTHEAEALDAVQIQTIHAAKGREYGVVYLPRLRLPPSGGYGNEAEEARVLFVAMSRARDRLVLSRVGTAVSAGPTPTGLWSRIAVALAAAAPEETWPLPPL